jgi:hypothetical protein
MKRALALLVMLSIMVSAKSIVATFDAPSGDIAGLGWESGSLWAVDAMLKTVYEIDPSSGDVISSFQAAVATGFEATGLAVENGYVYVGSWNNSTSGYVYKYDCSGSYLGAVSMCGG